MDDDSVIEPFNAAVITDAPPRHNIGHVHLEQSLDKISRLFTHGISADDMDFRGRPLTKSILTPRIKQSQSLSRTLIAQGQKLRDQCERVGDDFDGEVVGKTRYLVLFDPKSKQTLLSNLPKDDSDLIKSDSRFSKPFMIYATPIIVINENDKVNSFAWKINGLDDIDVSPNGLGLDAYNKLVKEIDSAPKLKTQAFAAE